jgi:uncharacterized membrane protein YgcG
MARFTRCWTAWGLLLAGGLAAAQPAGAPRKVQDDAGLFSAQAREKANEQIAEIRRRFGKDLAVETVASVARPRTLDTKDREAVARFFDEWAARQFQDQRVNGVLVLVVREPPILRIVVGRKTREGGLFTKNDRVELTKQMVARLKAGKADEALTAATAFVLRAMQDNAPTAVKEKRR